MGQARGPRKWFKPYIILKNLTFLQPKKRIQPFNNSNNAIIYCFYYCPYIFVLRDYCLYIWEFSFSNFNLDATQHIHKLEIFLYIIIKTPSRQKKKNYENIIIYKRNDGCSKLSVWCTNEKRIREGRERSSLPTGRWILWSCVYVSGMNQWT